MPTDPNPSAVSVLARVGRAVAEPLVLLLEPGERLFVGFLLSSALIAGLVSVRQRRAGRARGLRVGLWWHPSARLDYQLLLLKAWLRPLLAAPLLGQSLGLMALTAALLELSLGRFSGLAAPRWAIVIGYTLLTFLADDWSRYWLHRLMHRVPRLWQIHQLHHSARVLTPFTLHRIHPVEGLLYALRAGIVTGIPAGVFYYLFRGHFGSVEVLGVNALGFAFNVLGANLRHSHVYLSYGRALERWLISPAQHQIHHGRAARYHDRNFGSFLALWDRLAGTLALAEGRQAHGRMQVGLAAGARNHGQTLVSALVGPARAALSRRPV